MRGTDLVLVPRAGDPPHSDMQDESNSVPGAQTCVVSGVNSQDITIRGTALRLSRQTVVFEIYAPSTILMLAEMLNDFTIVVQDRTVYFGRAVVRSLITTGSTEVCEAELSDGWTDIDVLIGLTERNRLAGEVQAHLQQWQKQYRVDSDLKLHVSDLQTFLMELRSWTGQVELGVRAAPTGDRGDLECQVTCEIADGAVPYLNGLFDKFEQLFERVEEPARALHRDFVRRQLHPLVLCAPFAYRTFCKPLGYAGDYEMVNMIWRNSPEGGSLYAKVLNTWFLRQPPAVAHRNRLQYLIEKLIEESTRARLEGRIARILSVGCGPGIEVGRFLEQQPVSDHAQFALLDFNEETLQHASAVLEQTRLRNHRRTTLTFLKRSVYQLLKESGRAVERSPQHRYDVVYCAGLFDYLVDSVCQRLMQIFHGWLAPGGLLILTNVDPSNPRRHTMETLLDWPLRYRRAGDLSRLLGRELPAQESVTRADLSGVNLFMEVRKRRDD